MRRTYLPVWRRALLCFFFALAFKPFISKRSSFPQNASFRVRIQCLVQDTTTPFQVRSYSKISPIKLFLYFLNPLNSLECNWYCLNFYRDWGNPPPGWVPWSAQPVQLGAPDTGSKEEDRSELKLSYPNFYPYRHFLAYFTKRKRATHMTLLPISLVF